MLVRDPSMANEAGLVAMMQELRSGSRQVAVFLLDLHPAVAPYVSTDVVVGLGWDDNIPEGEAPSLRWFGEGMTPSGVGSCIVSRNPDPEVILVQVANRLARSALKLEKQMAEAGKLPAIWTFAQHHIKTVADCQKLQRFMDPFKAVAKA